MAVFRINKTQDYTVMSNFHLKDRSLSLKSKGLLSLILSLPEDWDYTTRGLAAICKEGVDSIGTALKELDGAGYIKRNLNRDAAMLDEIVDLMTETVCTQKSSLVIAGDTYPAAIVKSKLLKLTSEHIEYVIDCMRENTSDIRNIKKYLLAALFNAPSTIDSYYTTKVHHDMANF